MPISTDSALPENRVKISEDLRSMNVPTGEQVLGCVGDAWVRRVWFDMPRYCDGTDLSGYTLSVNYRNTDEDEDRYPVNDAVVNADTITFSWLVGAVACAAPGLTSVSIKAQKLNGDTVENEFNSTIYYFKVLPANTTGAEPLQEYSDAFTTLMLQWQAEVDTAVAEAPKGKLVGTASGTTAQTVNDAWPTALHGATVYGKSVQDGTPTPDNPVPVQVVGGRNLAKNTDNMTPAPNQTLVIYDAATMPALPIGKLYFSLFANGLVYEFGSAGFVRFTRSASNYWLPGSFGMQPNTPNNGTFVDDFTNAANDPVVKIEVILSSTSYAKFTAGTCNMQIEAGHATPYTPYGCIGLQIGETVTPIDLQGHTLAGLPDGARDVLRVDSAGRVWIEQNVIRLDAESNWRVVSSTVNSHGLSYIEIYTDLPGFPDFDLGATYIKSNHPIGTGLFSQATGREYACNISTLFYRFPATAPVTLEQGLVDMRNSGAYCYLKLATPQTIELGTIDLPELTSPCELAIYASLDPEWAIEYEQDPNAVITSLQASIAPVEGSTASTNYAVNSYLIHANQLYRVTSAIATGEAITPGSNCVACTVMGEVIRLTA